MHVVIAPDKFKGTLSAAEAAEAMAKGVRAAIPHASMTLRPMADGGEGTVDALLVAHGGKVTMQRVTGPLSGVAVDAPLGHLPDGTCVLELATAAGLNLIEPERRDALASSSLGLGQLIAAALEQGERKIVIGVGDTASTDGATGAARAVGWRFLDAGGADLELGGGSLRHLARIDASGVHPALNATSFVAACDVDNPLLGQRGAARVFAPQKGASEAEVALLEEGLSVLAERIRADLGHEVAGTPGAGAGGGSGAGLMAFFGAKLGRGFEIVADAAGLAHEIEQADFVLTGEGRLDDQSLGGKTPVGVAHIAREIGVKCFAVAGEVPLDPGALKGVGISAAASLIEAVGAERAFEDPVDAVAKATAAMLRHQVTGEAPAKRRFGFKT
ncbi:MAG: glycerate kinase [Actinomycetota bacterium]|nr:glycerate kinase [Actinomycetota bacterium]